jgi:carbonic anhydrase
VQWLVLQERIPISAEQVAAFAARIGPNNRPVQAINARVVGMVVVNNTAGN